MTVHKAKGLEFPVVILADLTCRISRSDASRYLDPARRLCAMKIGGWAPHELYEHEAEEVARDKAEGVRLAYVAATRARDLIVVPALGDEPWEGGWFGPLNAALYPPVNLRRTPARGPKCPAFRAKDTVAERPNDEPAGMFTVCPGQHTFPADGYSVVWWEPGPGGGLTLGEKPQLGVRRAELIVKDVPRDVIADGRTRYDRWRLARNDARESGAMPSIAVQTVREWAADPGAIDPLAGTVPDVTVVDLTATASGGQRSGGPAFGTLVHAVLAQAPFEAGDSEIRAIAAVEARVLSLTEADAAAAVAAVRRVFAHDVVMRARAAAARGACHRETPVTCTLPNGTLIEGVVDLAFEEQGHWYIVDYKTDRDFDAGGEDQYRRQVSLYTSAIALATGCAASGVVIRA
jgi:ATP-dependent exoDNAse (exonuclease V) beta subunit